MPTKTQTNKLLIILQTFKLKLQKNKKKDIVLPRQLRTTTSSLFDAKAWTRREHVSTKKTHPWKKR